MNDMPILVLGADLAGAVSGSSEAGFAPVLGAFVGRQRWFAGKADGPATAAYRPAGGGMRGDGLLGEAVMRTGRGEQRYFLPLAVRPRDAASGNPLPPHALAEASRDGSPAMVVDAALDPDFVRWFVTILADGRDVPLGEGRLRIGASRVRAEAVKAAAGVEATGIAPLSGEQSNTSVGVGDVAILKFYRQLRDGTQPELEVTRFLTEQTGFRAAPALLASAELERPDGTRAAVAALFERVANRGDAWSVVTGTLVRHLGGDTAERGGFDPGETVGRRTGEMHAALATVTGDPDFDPEPIDAAALGAMIDEAAEEARNALESLRRLRGSGGDWVTEEIDALLAAEPRILAWFEDFRGAEVSGHRTRIHGDYHLGQILVSGDDVVILDFEGEPGRSLEERRAKTSPLRDVAGMLRSYDYAAFAARDGMKPAEAADAGRIREAAEGWREAVSAGFLSAWQAASGIDLSGKGTQRLLDLFLLQKAFYELRYEAAMRPAWLSIPLRGIVSLLQKRQVI